MKNTALALVPFLLAGAPTQAGKWTFGARAGMTQTDGTFVPTFAGLAEYTMGGHLSWRTDLEVRMRDLAKADEFALSVPTQLLWHPLGNGAAVDPYVGPGLSASMGFDRTLSAGPHATGGVLFHPRSGQAFGLEARWGVPDVFRDPTPSFALSLVGNWNWKTGRM